MAKQIKQVDAGKYTNTQGQTEYKRSPGLQ
jgi:hypothetical protein